MHSHDILIALFAFLSELLGTLSGFGSSSFFVPLAALFEKFTTVLFLTALLHSFSNLVKIFLFRTHFTKDAILKLALPSILFTGLGAIATQYVGSEWLYSVLAGFLILFSIFKLLDPKSFVIPSQVAVYLSAISGFLTGLIGTGGALRGLLLTALRLEKNQFVAVSGVIDVGGDWLRLLIYIKHGYANWHQWYQWPLLIIAAFLGISAGRFLLNKIPQHIFEKIVAVAILLSGLVIVFQKVI